MPTWRARAIFGTKVAVLRLRRGLRDRIGRLPRHPRQGPEQARTLAEVRFPLISDAAPEERRYELGKIQNVRAAAARLDGTRVPAGAVFSFWRQLGRCTRRRGFVVGRQIQEGCLIPSVGGGLCLLSNALFAAARGAGLEVVERHPHTRAVPGSFTERGEDATVAWNHIDLRFRHSEAWALRVPLTTHELVVRIEGRSGRIPLPLVRARPSSVPLLDPAAHACGRCGRTDCSRYVEPRALSGEVLTLALDLEPEFVEGTAWTLLGAPLPLRLGVLKTRLAGRREWRRKRTKAAVELARAETWARALAGALPYETARVRVDLRLLPWLWRSGALGGREYEVLALRPPLDTLQTTLDGAADIYPDRRLLRDFRAPEAVVCAEREALLHTARVVTPHAHIAESFGLLATLVPWNRPEPVPWKPGRTILFPGPTHARKGAYEVRAAAIALELPVRVAGSELEGPNFWTTCSLSPSNEGAGVLDDVLAVVQPALVEERPRLLLLALASGVPVIATAACGLPPQVGLTLVPEGDSEAIIQALRVLLNAGP